MSPCPLGKRYDHCDCEKGLKKSYQDEGVKSSPMGQG